MNRSDPRQHTPLSARAAHAVFLALCALIPLAMHTGVYSYALLPKRFLLLLGLTIVALTWAFDLRTGRTQLRNSPFYLPLFAYLALTLLSFTQAHNPVAALGDIGHLVAGIGLFALVLHTFPPTSLPAFLRISAGVGILVSTLGILEARGIDASWLPLSNGRPSATFEYRNFAAAYLIMSLPLCALLWLRAKRISDAYLGIAATALMFVFLIYTRTRGAWVGLTCALFIVLALTLFARLRWHTPISVSTIIRRNRQTAIAAGLAFCCALLLAGLSPDIASRHSRAIDEKKVALLDALSFTGAPSADRGRLVMWRHTLEMIKDHPLLGVGPGNWQYVYPRYDRGDMLRPDSAPERPHNEGLRIASESGIPALLAFVGLLIVLARSVWRILKTETDPDRMGCALAFSISLLAMLGHGMVSFPSERIEPSFLFWFGLGILAQMAAPTSVSLDRSARAQWAAWGLAGVLILLIGQTYRHLQFDRHALKAFTAHTTGDAPAMLREATSALEWGPFNPQIYLLQGNGYQATGLFSRAESAYRTGLQYAPNSVQLMKALGTAFAMQQKLEQAEQQYRAVLEIYPDFYQVINDLGNIHHQRSEFSKAIAAYRRAASRLGDAADIQRNLALAYVAADSLPQAIKIYNHLLSGAPDDVALYYELGEAYFKQARREPGALPYARASFERFLKRWRGPEQYAEQARLRLIDIQNQQREGPQ